MQIYKTAPRAGHRMVEYTRKELRLPDGSSRIIAIPIDKPQQRTRFTYNRLGALPDIDTSSIEQCIHRINKLPVLTDGIHCYGNISHKTKTGMLITISGLCKQRVDRDAFALVTDVDYENNSIDGYSAANSCPSSESITHQSLYSCLGEGIRWILHGHPAVPITQIASERYIAEGKGDMVLKPYIPYGDPALGRALSKLHCGRNASEHYVVAYDHGFFAYGSSWQQACTLVERMYNTVDRPIANALGIKYNDPEWMPVIG